MSVASRATFNKPFFYGSAAFFLGQRDESPHTHSWTVYVRGFDNEDLSYFIKKVAFTLHVSFQNNVREIDSPPFEVTETGWGEFPIQIRIHFHDLRESPVMLTHNLKLYPEPPGVAQVKGKPVISEHYDEFIFVGPTDHFHDILLNARPQRLDDHFLAQFWAIENAKLKEAEKKELALLAAAERDVATKIHDLRLRLRDAERELRGSGTASGQAGTPGTAFPFAAGPAPLSLGMTGMPQTPPHAQLSLMPGAPMYQ